MKKLTLSILVILTVIFSFDVQAQSLESIRGGIFLTSNQNTHLSYDGRVPGLETGLTFLLFPFEEDYGVDVIAESNLRFWTEALKRNQYSQKFTCQMCSINEQAALSLTTEIGLRYHITLVRKFYLSFLTGLNYEMRFFNETNFPNPDNGYREFNIGLLGKARLSSFITNRTMIYFSWQSAYYEFADKDTHIWSMQSLSAGISYTLN